MEAAIPVAAIDLRKVLRFMLPPYWFDLNDCCTVSFL